MKLGIPFTNGYAQRCVKVGKLLIGQLIWKGWGPSRKWFDVTMMSSMDQWEEGIPWKYLCEGIKGGNE